MKMFRTIAAMLLCAVMLVSMSACSLLDDYNDEQKLVGKWTSEPIDISDAVKEGFYEGMAEEDAQYFELGDYSLSLSLEFGEDMMYTLKADDASTEAMLNAIIDDCKDGFVKMMDGIAADNNITTEQLLEAMEYDSVDAFIEDSLSDVDFEALTQDMTADTTSSGEYEIRKGQLYFLGEESGTFTDLFDYVLDGDTLTLTAPEEYADDYDFEFPLTFTRQ